MSSNIITMDRGNTNFLRSKLERRERCPECAKRGLDTKEDNLGVFDDGHKYCFSCGYYEGLIMEEFTYEYLPWRSLSKETMAFFDIKTKINVEGKPVSIGFPYPDGFYKVRNYEKKDFYIVGEHKPGLFGRDKFPAGCNEFLTITEGELDAASLWQVLGTPCVSVQGSASALRDCSVDIDYIRSFRRINLAFDNDAAGRSALRSVAKLLDPNRIRVVKFSVRKDANEHLQHGEGEELRQIWWNARRYTPDNIVSSLEEFRKILSEEAPKGLPYPAPFHKLNEMTYGIRRGETVLITAQEKVGKTELMHAIEYQILKETDSGTGVGAFFIEEPKQRHLRALASFELGQPTHLPDCAIGDSAISTAIEKVVGKDERLFIYSHYGYDDPNVLLDTIRHLVVACNCHYILFDHLTMAISGIQGEQDERRAIDYLITQLAMMVKELMFALLIVCHVNDFGQTRGSRLPTKVADITINATRDLMSDDPIVRNTINLSVPYNRFAGGRTGSAGSYLFDPNVNKYSEIVSSAANDNQTRDERKCA